MVWYGEQGNIEGFQLCYDVGGKERALTWQARKGYAHNRVDEGDEVVYRMKMSPILVSDGLFDQSSVAQAFRERSVEMDSALAAFIYGKLLQYQRE